MHNLEVEGPFAGHSDDHFVVRFSIDVTMEGQRSQMNEVGLYTVANGKLLKKFILVWWSKGQLAHIFWGRSSLKCYFFCFHVPPYT